MMGKDGFLLTIGRALQPAGNGTLSPGFANQALHVVPEFPVTQHGYIFAIKWQYGDA
jgi:hypothetical protein